MFHIGLVEALARQTGKTSGASRTSGARRRL